MMLVFVASRNKKQEKTQNLHILCCPSFVPAVSSIDTSGVSIFKELKKTVEQKGAEVSSQSAKAISSCMYVCCTCSKV